MHSVNSVRSNSIFLKLGFQLEFRCTSQIAHNWAELRGVYMAHNCVQVKSTWVKNPSWKYLRFAPPGYKSIRFSNLGSTAHLLLKKLKTWKFIKYTQQIVSNSSFKKFVGWPHEISILHKAVFISHYGHLNLYQIKY